MNNTVLSLANIHKQFDGRSVLRALDLDVPPGTILGLMGRNGAGKSTLIKCLLGFIYPDSGYAAIFGENSRDLSADVRQRIGYVPQTMKGFRWMNVENFLEYTGSFYRKWNRNKVDLLLRELELRPEARISQMSEGELQKLSIIRALGHEPELLIFDEPAASLDPLARRQFLRRLIEISMDENRTMLFSSHIASDLERVANDISIIKEGRIAYRGDLGSLQERIRKIHIQSDRKLPDPLPVRNVSRCVVEDTKAVVTVDGLDDGEIQKLGETLSARVSTESLNLEDIFLEVSQ
ncbi:MAG: ABC transporter ATP-binding protein [Acidobacteriota bacterium]|jgi:ABC-2 type transport system ATP-binding protein|nr:ABC transporter ATP-binding protein [Acidobacteriota bacterium]